MLVRLLALLIALGLMAITVQASDLGTAAAGIALVDEVEDVADPELITVVGVVVHPDRTIDALAGCMQPPHYQHPLFVFRPPRAPTFN